MTETSNWLRATYGPDVILNEGLREYEAALARGEQYKGVVMYSIRAPIEADFIVNKGGELIWTQTDDTIRHERRIKHIREGEARVTLEEMMAQEALQANPQPGIPREAQMDLNYVKSKATITLKNNGDDLEEFESQAKGLVERLSN